MATNTTNYGWTKPDYEDDADIAVLNETFDAIDAQVKTIETALNSKQTALSTAQLAAVNSGIDSTKVAQIATNADNEAEDRAALVELVDGGAKNLLNSSAITNEINDVTFTVNSDGSIVLSGTANAHINSYFLVDNIPIPTDKPCILSGCPAGGSDDGYRLDMLVRGVTSMLVADYGSGANIDWSLFTGNIYAVRIRIASGTNTNGLVFKPMICTKAAWDVSQAYQPYRPSYQELYERVIALEQANA